MWFIEFVLQCIGLVTVLALFYIAGAESEKMRQEREKSEQAQGPCEENAPPV